MNLAADPILAGALDFVTRAVSGATWTYFLVLGIVALDSFFPIAPSETVVIAAAVLATRGQLLIWGIIAAAAVGAVVGDNVSYFLGDRLGDWAAPKLFRGEKGRKGLEWGKRQIRRHPWVIIIARFIPGGRTATTFASGWLTLPWRRFMRFDVPGGILWALYTAMLGYLGASAFQNSLWKSLLLGVGIAGVIALAIEGVRLIQGHHGEGGGHAGEKGAAGAGG